MLARASPFSRSLLAHASRRTMDSSPLESFPLDSKMAPDSESPVAVFSEPLESAAPARLSTAAPAGPRRTRRTPWRTS